MKKAWPNIYTILFWASLWGIIEATVGCVLHLLPIHIGWLFWSPIAFYCMSKVYSKTKSPSSVLYAALISSAIKLLDLLFPIRIDMVINPTISILLEGLTLFALYKLSIRFSVVKRVKLLFAVGISSTWRVLYLFYILLTPQWMIAISPYQSIDSMIEFLVIQNFIIIAIIFLYAKYKATYSDVVSKKLEQLIDPLRTLNRLKLNPVMQAMAIVFVLSINILLKFIL